MYRSSGGLGLYATDFVILYIVASPGFGARRHERIGAETMRRFGENGGEYPPSRPTKESG